MINMSINEQETDNCEVNIVHNDIVEYVKSKLLDYDKAYSLSEFFKIFGDTTRVKIIHAISLKEMCVCDISALLGVSQSATSHQLKVLRQFRLVKLRKEGKMVYYSLSDEHVRNIFNEGITHIEE
jgi:ArsR family transcriptional regulator